MKNIIFLALIAATAPALAADLKLPAVHGHRGSRGTVPENTLPAFEAALMGGADVLEFDLGVTKDGVVVVSHEPKVTPERCLDAGGKRLDKPVPLRDLTLAQLKKYDCGTLLNPKFPQQIEVPGTPMPTLDEVFELVEKSGYAAAPKVEFNIETKIFPYDPDLSPSPEEFARLVTDVVKKHGMEARVIVQSFDVRTLRAVKKLAPAIRTSQLTYESLVDIVPALKSAKVDIWSPNYKWITAEAVREAQAAGIKVAPWTINTRKEWDIAIAAGVDAIITDYPAALVEHLESLRAAKK
ncbi:MAG: glycerophosphodiester phosphodiesterase [Elusimicrobia bacterium HGW-Elusimicrobia-3]|nr:MAG: glycerophosphodiester phosphodiesterase [Elusimicrobia bacterium HGW-Elusimicrobia-3]